MFKGLLKSFKKAASSSRIVFERVGDKIANMPLGIHTINPDGTDCRRLHPTGRCPRWSPDGQWIAFSEDVNHFDNYGDYQGSKLRLLMMQPNGGAVRELVTYTYNFDDESPSITSLSWSFDSKKIAYDFWTSADRSYQIWVVDIQSLQKNRLTDNGSNASPVWTPSNDIVFTNEDASDLLIMDSNGRNPRSCKLFNGDDYDPRWSFDGMKISFLRNSTICVMNADGSGFKTIAAEGAKSEVALSPDCETLAYCSRLQEGSIENWTAKNIFTIEVSGLNQRKIVANVLEGENEVNSHSLSWSPWL